MKKFIDLNMTGQPDYTSCGPTSLYAIYNYWNDDISKEELLAEIAQFDEGGGTLAVILGIHAIRRGYKVKIYNYNINIFDPSWFSLSRELLISKLEKRIKVREGFAKEVMAMNHYIEYIRLGGKMLFNDLNNRLIKKYLKKEIPILAGLSSTWLYQTMREDQITNEDDDIAGHPAGHFVVVHGIDLKGKLVHVADPYRPNPISGTNYYKVELDRLINSILLGITSYDGNLLIIEK